LPPNPQLEMFKTALNPSDFVHFHKRIGEEGMNRIFKQSIYLEDAIRREIKEVRANTTLRLENLRKMSL
jgi:hypothetical protein